MKGRHHHRGVVVVFFGMTGSGKSYLAKEWARRSGCHYFNTDIIRKELAAKDGSDKSPQGYGQGIYSVNFSRQTYGVLREYVEAALSDNLSACVVIDGSYQKRQQRLQLMEQFSGRVDVYFVHCFCLEDVTRKRLLQRLHDRAAVSDGTLAVFIKQKEHFEAPDEILPHQFLKLDTDGSLEYLIEKLEQFLKEVRGSTGSIP